MTNGLSTSQELSRLSQTNVTPEHEAGLRFATEAYDLATNPLEEAVAARQAGVRAGLAGLPLAEVNQWFDRSWQASAELPREAMATRLNQGRVCAYRGLEDAGEDNLLNTASGAFAGGEAMLRAQHSFGTPWDRFATMLSRHWATHEAVSGDATFAAITSIRGVWRAVRAEQENQPLKEHARFVAKQMGSNVLAGMLALSKPLSVSPKLEAKRKKFAARMLS